MRLRKTFPADQVVVRPVPRRRAVLSIESLERRLLFSIPPGGLNFFVRNTNISGSGSLATAINGANNVPNSSIIFNIPTTDPGYDPTYKVFRIKPRVFSDLPAITGNGTVIDGSTEDAFIGHGNLAGVGPTVDLVAQYDPDVHTLYGLQVSAGSCTVNDLGIANFVNAGIAVSGSSNAITNNYIGTSEFGAFAVPNGGGVVVTGATNTLSGNVISGNRGAGVELTGSASHDNVVVGNLIGITAFYDSANPNTGAGVLIHAGAAGNQIGTDRGSAATSNVISGNGGAGVEIADVNTTNNFVDGNFIGTNRPTTGGAIQAIGNAAQGVYVHGAADANHIGDPGISIGTEAGGNVIAGNASSGVFLSSAINTNVYNNFIGTDPSRTASVPNGGYGVRADLGSGNRIGDYIASNPNVYGNVVGFNRLAGIASLGGGTAGPVIGKNTIFSNSGDGITLASSNSRVENNTITGNGGNGVTVTSGSSNFIHLNSIYSNTGIGIDLGNDGATLNTPGGPHTGPNLLQNHPVITSLTTKNGSSIIGASLNSAPNATYTIEFFASNAAVADGATYLGVTTVSTDGTGNATFQYITSPAVSDTDVVTATATDASGNTSEFSGALEAFSLGSGSGTHSMVRSFQITFPTPVMLSSGAFTIALHPGVIGHPNGVGTVPDLSFSSPDRGKTYLVVIAGPGVINGSIADGVYDFTIHAAKVTPYNAGGAPLSDTTFTFFRLFGDVNGDGVINNTDYFQFRNSFNKPRNDPNFFTYFDFNGDNLINNGDYFQFRNRFNTSLVF